MLRPLLRHWLIPPAHPDMTDAEYIATSHQRVENELMIEQLRNGMSVNLQRHLDARNPTTVEELCQCVEAYQLQHPRSTATERRLTTYQSQPRKYGNTVRTSTSSLTPTKPRKDSSKMPEKKTVTCFKCKKLGHYAWECTEEAFLLKKTVEEDQSHKRV